MKREIKRWILYGGRDEGEPRPPRGDNGGSGWLLVLVLVCAVLACGWNIYIGNIG